MIEIWKPVVGFENEYCVSNNGRIKSLPKKTRKGIRDIKINYTQGYAYVHLCKDKNVTKYRVHRLVALAFISNPLNLPQVNHIDKNRSNNQMDNLEWVTAQRNIEHSIAKSWEFIKNGEPIEIFNMRKYCRENNLKHQYFSLLKQGRLQEYAGFTCPC
jgi:hypothetical protein